MADLAPRVPRFLDSAFLVEPDAASAANLAARIIASALRASLASGRTASLGLSGGTTPKKMFLELSQAGIDWERVHIVQVDERLVPPDHRARNLTALRADLLDRIPAPASLTALPVDGDLGRVASKLEGVLSASRFDVMHLGLGGDGHSASLFAGDPDLGEGPLVETPQHNGHRRVSLAEPVLANARLRLVLCTGSAKSEALANLRSGNTTSVLSRMLRGATIVVADVDAAGLTSAS